MCAALSGKAGNRIRGDSPRFEIGNHKADDVIDLENLIRSNFPGIFGKH